MKSIYILLTRTNTFVSRAIYALTRDKYTHVALSLDDSFECLYSFGRKYPRLALPAGYVKESIYQGILGKNGKIDCAVYRMEISDGSYVKLKKLLEEMEQDDTDYQYNLLGLWSCFFGYKWERETHFFCSEFVAHALSEAEIIEFEKDCSLIKPMDFSDLSELTEIFNGNIGELRELNMI